MTTAHATTSMTLSDIALYASDDISFRMALQHAPDEVIRDLNLDEGAKRALVCRKQRDIRQHLNSAINAETTVVTATAVLVATNVLVV
jgi:hypothetical protein